MVKNGPGSVSDNLLILVLDNERVGLITVMILVDWLDPNVKAFCKENRSKI